MPTDLVSLYWATPGWLLRRIARHLGVTAEAAHEWLCDWLGCRCADLDPAVSAAGDAAA